jgi:hypothetical protein
MSDLKELDELWGTTIYGLEIDYLLNRSRFYIKFPYRKGIKFYELSFERMFSFHMKNEDASPGRYTELTEIYSKKTKKGYEFTLLILDEDYTIDIECEDWKLTLLEEYNEND